jgi:CheY-like chemotaxis protein
LTTPTRVLVVDDDHALRSTTAEILRHLGYAVSEAQDGTEALDKLRGEEIEALVMDVRMPRLDGTSAIAQINPEPPPPGVLLVTAYTLEPETRAELGSRVCKVLRKPVPPVTLIAAVEEAVEVARSASRA